MMGVEDKIRQAGWTFATSGMTYIVITCIIE